MLLLAVHLNRVEECAVAALAVDEVVAGGVGVRVQHGHGHGGRQQQSQGLGRTAGHVRCSEMPKRVV